MPLRRNRAIRNCPPSNLHTVESYPSVLQHEIEHIPRAEARRGSRLSHEEDEAIFVGWQDPAVRAAVNGPGESVQESRLGGSAPINELQETTPLFAAENSTAIDRANSSGQERVSMEYAETSGRDMGELMNDADLRASLLPTPPESPIDRRPPFSNTVTKGREIAIEASYQRRNRITEIEARTAKRRNQMNADMARYAVQRDREFEHRYGYGYYPNHVSPSGSVSTTEDTKSGDNQSASGWSMQTQASGSCPSILPLLNFANLLIDSS
ncbi:hypothetical protein B7494_g3691 [Chlorociboria aeruginascens]|nr:hypothetical protein B7494_g3691 [Chlorociboria aeruginascens]